MQSNFENQGRNSVHVLSLGPFGQSVAAVLSELLPDAIETRSDANQRTSPAQWPLARVHILAAWRPTQRWSRLFDEVCHFWKAPFIAAVMEPPCLRIGPVVVPGGGACHGCYEKRDLQHAPRPIEKQALYDFYDAHPQCGPQGYLAPMAEIAAVRLAQFIGELDSDPAAVAGKVWQLDAISLQMSSGVVVGVHNCPRCGLRRDEATRSYEAIRRDLYHIDLGENQERLYRDAIPNGAVAV